MTNQRILISLAHPDDESFGLGGLIAKYVKSGAQVDYLCATNGDVGTIDPELLEGYDSPAALRLAELDCASEILGFTNVVKFGYKDSGMMGTADNEDPTCLWSVHTHTPEVVVRRVVETIRELKPQVIITFNKYGGYGHPDHIAIQRATTEAFKLAGDASYVTEGLDPYQPQKLYYNNIPRWMIQFRIWTLRVQGKDPRAVGRNNDIDIVKILDNIEPAHVRIDVRDHMDDWARASACHKSQGGGLATTSLWVKLIRTFLGVKQGFTRISPAPAQNRIDENDLFDNVTLDDPVSAHVRA
ncbi:MAG: PIG-L family deacetylase [Aggregatilineales bacterium]